MKRLLLLLALAAIALPVAASSVTKDQTSSYTGDGVTLDMLDPAGSVYQQGESIAFTVRADSDAYVIVFNIDTDGYVNLLYPRNSRSLLGFAGGRTYAIPADVSQELLVSGKTGIEFVFAVSIKERGAINDGELAAMLQDEAKPLEQRFRVAGDPFLAANRTAGRLISGIAYTQDESMAYTYFYVNEAVDYPRYLCRDCEGQGVDPYSQSQNWVATSAFDSEDHLSYPLKQAFVRSDESVTLLSPETETASDTPTPVYVYNTYTYASYPYYPGYWGSSFYFGVGWNWGWGVGWRWGHPYWYYPWYGYAWCRPYAVPHQGHWGYGGRYRHGHNGPVAYRPGIRPRTGTRVKGGTGVGANYMPKAQTASRLRSKSTRYQRANKGGATYGSTRLARSGAKSRPVYKFDTKTRTGVRGYQTTKLRSQSGVRHKTGKGYTTRNSNRPVRTIKGQPTTRRTVSRGQTSVRRSNPSTRRGTSGTSVRRTGSSRTRSGYSPTTRRTTGSSRVKSTTSRSSRGRSGYSKPSTSRSRSSGAVSRGGSRSASRGGSSKARGGSRSGGRRK